jgi:hypothetical protein
MAEQGRVDLERMRAVYEHEPAAMERAASEQRIRVIRAQARIDHDCHMVGRVGRFRLESDEPQERGGGDSAPTPAAVPAVRRGDLTADQTARFAPLYQVQIQEATAEVRGRFSPADKLGLEGPGSAFEEVAVVLEVRSPVPTERVRELVAHAERGCHSAQSLRVAVPVRLLARLNGDDLNP